MKQVENGKKMEYYEVKTIILRGSSMYEILVLGATYAAAGLAKRYAEKCLVLESRAEAGYEFFKNADRRIYHDLKECRTVFGAKVVSVEKTEKGFLCVTHGVEGFRSYEARRVVDTRCNAAMSESKTYDLLIDRGGERELLRLPVPLDCSFPEARKIAKTVMEGFSTERLVYMADEFDYRVKAGYPKEENGILYLPSKAYETPELAFKAGQEVQ